MFIGLRCIWIICMSEYLKIKNFLVVKDVEVELKKINVIIGF